MGVRGKMEAVIYAAEEPVTLLQLTALFGEEALAEREGLATDLARSAAAKPVAEQPELAGLQPSPLPEEDQMPVEADSQEASLEGELAGRKIARGRERAAREAVREIIDQLLVEYREADGGMEIREVAGGYRIATKPEYHDAVRSFVKSLKPVMKLSLQALETLAVIAYKQPVTAPEVSEIRGVDSGGVLGSLISRKLVTTAGRKPVVGRPILYKTTKEFLLRFGLKDIAELPSMEEFEKMAGELRGADLEESEALGDTPDAAADAREVSETAADQATSEEPRNTERPSLAPARIVVTVEDEPAPGISVTLSGTAQVDPAGPLEDKSIPDTEGEAEMPGRPINTEHE